MWTLVGVVGDKPMWLVLAIWHADNNYVAIVYLYNLYLYNKGRDDGVGGHLYLTYLLFLRLYTHNTAVIVHPNKQIAPYRVGKGDDLPRNLLCGSELALELHGR